MAAVRGPRAQLCGRYPYANAQLHYPLQGATMVVGGDDYRDDDDEDDVDDDDYNEAL